MKINKISSTGIPIDSDKFTKGSFEKLRELIEILNTCDNDYQRVIKLRRVCSSYASFEKCFYLHGKFREAFNNYVDVIETLRDMYKNYEESGLLAYAANEDKFLLRKEGDLDSRFIIEAYINDECSYDIDKFITRYRITYRAFKACVEKIKEHDSALYAKYLETSKNNITKRLVFPIYSINSILEGIKTGKTVDNRKLDALEFYRIAPFTNKDFDNEMRALIEYYPKLYKIKLMKSELKRDNSRVVGCTFAENLYLFTKCFNENDAELLKTWMEEHNIKNLTPIHRASTCNVYASNIDNNFTVEDANSVFDTIEEVGYPKVREVFELLKQNKINNNKSSKRKILEIDEKE